MERIGSTRRRRHSIVRLSGESLKVLLLTSVLISVENDFSQAKWHCSICTGANKIRKEQTNFKTSFMEGHLKSVGHLECVRSKGKMNIRDSFARKLPKDWGEKPLECMCKILHHRGEFLDIDIDKLHGEVSALLIQIKRDIRLKQSKNMAELLEELERIGGNFKTYVRVAKYFLSWDFSSCDCKRGFSLYNNIVTKLRNSLSLMIILNNVWELS